jgi:hypothetical protein
MNMEQFISLMRSRLGPALVIREESVCPFCGHSSAGDLIAAQTILRQEIEHESCT